MTINLCHSIKNHCINPKIEFSRKKNLSQDNSLHQQSNATKGRREEQWCALAQDKERECVVMIK